MFCVTMLIIVMLILYEKTTRQNQIRFIPDNYLLMYKNYDHLFTEITSIYKHLEILELLKMLGLLRLGLIKTDQGILA